MTDMLQPPTIETPDDVLRIQRRIADLEADAARLNSLIADYDKAIATIASMLNQEAEDRDWCDEYDEFVETLNKALPMTVPSFPVKKTKYKISFTVEELSRAQAANLESLIDSMLIDNDMPTCRNYETVSDYY
jgi:hypothetical protein